MELTRVTGGRAEQGAKVAASGGGADLLSLLLGGDQSTGSAFPATLEAALAGCPHVIFYRVSALTARIVGRKLLLPFVGLPNVLAGRFVVPELLQDHATPGNLAQAALNLFDDTITRHRTEMLFAKMSGALAMDTGELAADAVLDELDGVVDARGRRQRAA